MFKNNNKGFTLTEVVVASLVGSIVVVGIAVYTIVGVRNFNGARSETQAQLEADFIMMQLKDKLKTVKDYRVTDTGNYYAFEVISGTVDSDGSYKNTDYVFVLDRANTDMYLLSYNDADGYKSTLYDPKDPDSYFSFNSSDIDADAKNTSLLSLYATNFVVRPDKIDSIDADRTVTATIETSVGKTTITRSVTGYVRNMKEKAKSSGFLDDDPNTDDDSGD